MSYIDHKSYLYQVVMTKISAPHDKMFYGSYLMAGLTDISKEIPCNYISLNMCNRNTTDYVRVVLKIYGTVDVGETGGGIIDGHGLLLTRRDFIVEPKGTLNYREYPITPYTNIIVYREWVNHATSGNVDPGQEPIYITMTRLNTGDARSVADHYGKPVDDIYRYGSSRGGIKTINSAPVEYEGQVDTEIN